MPLAQVLNHLCFADLIENLLAYGFINVKHFIHGNAPQIASVQADVASDGFAQMHFVQLFWCLRVARVPVGKRVLQQGLLGAVGLSHWTATVGAKPSNQPLRHDAA